MKPADLLNELARFWSKVDKASDCWLWTGERGALGYGYFALWHDGQRSRLLAHRLVLLLTGVALDQDDVVLHACDVPACVNPSHLSVGTQKLNIRDAQQKGRLDTSGLFATTRRACKSCGEFFLGAPNRRYCDSHQPRSRSRARRLAGQEELAG